MEIIRSWREQKVMLKWKYPFLLEEDFAYESGAKESMFKRLSEKLKISRRQLESILAELQKF